MKGPQLSVLFLTLALVPRAGATAPELAAPESVNPSGVYLTIANAGRDAIGGVPAIVGNGSLFLAVYRDRRDYATNRFDIYATRVLHDGTVLDPAGIPIAVGPNIDPDPGNQYIPSVAFDGTNFVVVWVENRTQTPEDYEIFGARVTPGGAVLDPGGVQLTTGEDPQRMPTVAFDGTNLLVAWRASFLGYEGIHGLRFSKALQPLGAPFTVWKGTEPAKYPALAFDGTNYLCVWHDYRNVSKGIDVYGARISTSGVVLDPQSFPICSEAEDQSGTTVAWNGQSYLVVWCDARGGGDDPGSPAGAWATFVSPSGGVGTPFSVGPYLRADGAGPAVVVSDGTDFLVGWMQDHASTGDRQTDVYVRKVRADGTLEDRGVPAATHFWHQFGPVMGYEAGKLLVAWSGSGVPGCGECVSGQILENAPPSRSRHVPTTGGPGRSPSSPQAEPPWVAAESGVAEDLYSVSGFSSSLAYIGSEGPGGSGRHLRWDGNAWTTEATGVLRPYRLRAVSQTELWHTGWCARIERYSSSTLDFQNHLTPSANCDHIGLGVQALPQDGGTLAVGSDGLSGFFTLSPPIYSWPPTGTTLDLHDLFGSPLGPAHAVGEFGTVLRWNGAAWSAVSGVPTRQSLNGIWGSGPSDLFAVGDWGTILHFDGTSWSEQESGTREHLFAVWGISARRVYAVGGSGTILRYDGTGWTSEASGTTRTLVAIGASGRTLWAAGRFGTLLRKDLTLDGDLDFTGTIDVFDVVILAGSIVGNLPPGTAPFVAPALSADVNRDGLTDVFDLVLVQGFIVGNVPGLPVV